MSTLREICEQAGFRGDALDTAVAVALAESGGRANAHNPNAGTGDNSYGLFQINMIGSMGPARLQQFGLKSNEDLFDPLTNAKAAFAISNGGRNWQPWTTYTGGAYASHLGEDAVVDVTRPYNITAGIDPASGVETASDHVTHPVADPYAIGTGTPLTETGRGIADASAAAAARESTAMGNTIRHMLGLPAIAEPTPADLGQDPVGSADMSGHALGAGTGASPAGHGEGAALHTFLDSALAQKGDPYVFGAKGAPNDPNPKAFDCSGLTQWAAHQAGFDLDAGAAHQYHQLKSLGMLIPVDQAVHTPGALLFTFDGEPPTGAEPEEAHVAISLGNGKTIEAANPDDGVNSFDAGGGRFTFAAVLPGISDSALHRHLVGTGLPDVSDDATHSVNDLVHPLGSEATDALGSHPIDDGHLGNALGLGHGHTDGLDPSHDADPGDHSLDWLIGH